MGMEGLVTEGVIMRAVQACQGVDWDSCTLCVHRNCAHNTPAMSVVALITQWTRMAHCQTNTALTFVKMSCGTGRRRTACAHLWLDLVKKLWAHDTFMA